MTGPNMDPDSRVAFTEIKGDIKRILDGQQRTHDDMKETRETVAEHGKRITTLETDKALREGERKGVSLSSKIAWSVIGLVVGSGGSLIAVLELVK